MKESLNYIAIGIITAIIIYLLTPTMFSNKVESADDLSDFIKHSAKALNRKASINYR